MTNSLIAGVSGLVAHQRMLDVTGNNIANANTPGYKTRKTVFADLLYDTLRPPSAAFDGSIGSSNGVQLGSGVKVAQVGINFAQGIHEPTGGMFDFAIQGDGFFVIDNGTNNLYSRVGSFALDNNGTLVDPATGYRVQRSGNVGEGGGDEIGFQVAGDSSIRIPFGSNIPGRQTGSIEMAGNLPSSARGPAVAELTTAGPYQTGGTPATNATLLNAIDSNTIPYANGDTVVLSGTESDGAPIDTVISVNATTTIGELISEINATLQSATAQLDANGNLVVTANAAGESALSIAINDAAGNTGRTDFNHHFPIVTQAGSSGDTVQTVVEIFDVRGTAHSIDLTFRKVDDNIWDMTAAMNEADGVILDNAVQQIRINDDGSLQQVVGTGTGDANLLFRFAGVQGDQSLAVSFGSNNSFDGLTELGSEAALVSRQDGFPPGVLTGINMSSDGVIEGVATNGRKLAIAQLAMGSFNNPSGLSSRGDNYFEASLGSGEVQLGTPLSGNRGSIVGGHLEGSTVDIAEEFARLIIAQQGFSANARTISVTTEMLDELTRLV